jgi:hypothetical protein
MKVRSVRLLAASLALILAGFATASVCLACSIVVTPISVGASFKVKVTGYKGAVKGLRLNLTDSQTRVRSSVTDGNGIADFFNIPPGTQYLSADHDNGFGAQLDVKANGPVRISVPMRWPSIDPLHVRSLSGSMRAPNALLGRQPLSLELLEGISGRVLSNTSTTDQGEFDFGKLDQGLYFIHLPQLHGLVSVAVDPAAPARAEKLDLNLLVTSCGVMYTDQLQCPALDLHVRKLAGHVGNLAGSNRAQLVLLDGARSEVAHLETESDGRFSFDGTLEGTFELRIEGEAITPVHTSIHIEPTAHRESLEIEASYGAGCSTVRVK